MMAWNSIRVWCARFPLVLLLGLSGCLATESQQGDTIVYKKSILFTLMLLAIAVTMLVIGAGMVWETLRKPKRRKKSPRSQRTGGDGRRRAPAPPPKKKMGGAVVGAGIAFGGFLVLVIGVPSSLMQHVTISKDKVEMRLSVLWFSRGTREIPFSSISGIEKAEEEVLARRGKRTKETMILHLASGTEFHEMGPLEKAAFPKLMEAYDAQASLPFHHCDPFDQLLVAQAQVDGLAVVSNDPIFDRYGVSRIW